MEPEDVINIKENRFDQNMAYWKKLSAIIAVVGPTIFLLLALHPDLILRNNTPTGGDMGAHVWAPAYLRDHLLSNFKLSGWSMDWYSGLPIYRFYMVVPALMIVLLDVILPYGIAIKIIAVIGILTLPYFSWLFGRFAKFAYPIPELFAIAATIFLFDESFTIYGGNIASTMAGEFSFSIALSLAMLGFALLAKGLDTGKHRISAAIIISLSALSHGIVLLFVFGGAALMLVVWNKRESFQFGAKVIALAVLLSSFWIIPFVTSHAYMTDMKYEPRPSGATDSFWKMFFPLHTLLDISLTALAVVGAVTLVRSRHKAGTWMTLLALLLAAGVFIARNSLPVIGLLWNPRILPFLYLLRYFLFVIGLYELVAFALRVKSIARFAQGESGVPVVLDIAQPRDKFSFNLALLSGFAVFVLVAIGFRFQELPFGSTQVNSAGQYEYVWGPLRTKSSNDGFVDGWARWNFTGYEGKNAYGEYYGVVQTMKQLGADSTQGCGRALWENNGELNKYGTTMGLMLLPFWTDGCISSMEGLFFEAAGSTPYHFITAAAMSKQSSNPVRELRYDNNDAALGVRYMQELGVKYFMGFTPEAIAQASQQEGLTEVARSGPWVVYRVANSDVVTPLAVQPVVANISSSNPVVVSNVDIGEESVKFSVDKIGVPVLVRVSYFPNWKVDGAKGPYRVAPNMMVVIPTSTNVSMHFGWNLRDYVAYLLSFAGIAWIVVTRRRSKLTAE